jgi:hypothetical protein
VQLSWEAGSWGQGQFRNQRRGNMHYWSHYQAMANEDCNILRRASVPTSCIGHPYRHSLAFRLTLQAKLSVCPLPFLPHTRTDKLAGFMPVVVFQPILLTHNANQYWITRDSSSKWAISLPVSSHTCVPPLTCYVLQVEMTDWRVSYSPTVQTIGWPATPHTSVLPFRRPKCVCMGTLSVQ